MFNPKKIMVDDSFNLYVDFENGEKRKINIKTFIDGKSAIKDDLKLCKQAYIEDGVISWPIGISIDPEHVYKDGEVIDSIEVASKYLDRINTHYN
jgi:hypothetical protein